MDVFADVRTQEVIRREFSYVFEGPDYPGIPELKLHTINGFDPFYINNVMVIPLEVLHYRLPVLGFRIKDFTYITDANFISTESMRKMEGTKVLVLNALRREKHISHFNLPEAVDIASTVNAERTYFTHLSHQMGLHSELANELPQHIQPAYDGLSVEI